MELPSARTIRLMPQWSLIMLLIEKILDKPLPVYQCGSLKFMLFPVLPSDEDGIAYRLPYRVFKSDGCIPTAEEVESLAPVVQFLLQPTEGEA